MRCIGRDPLCPCQDGLVCHYRDAADGTKGFPLPAKTTSERVDKLRKDRAALGLKRKEVCVHDDDWPELLKLAKRLERRRAKLLASVAG